MTILLWRSSRLFPHLVKSTESMSSLLGWEIRSLTKAVSLIGIAAVVMSMACGADSTDPQDRIVEAHVKLLGRDTVGFKQERIDLISGKTDVVHSRTDLIRNVTFARQDDDLPTLLMQEDVYVLIASSAWQYVAQASLPVFGFRWLMPIAEWDYDVELLADDGLEAAEIERYRGTTQWEGFRVQGFQEFEAAIRREDGELVAIQWVTILTHGNVSPLESFSRNSCTGSGLRLAVQEEFVEDDYFESVRGRLGDSGPLAAKCESETGNVVAEWASLSATRTVYTIMDYNHPLDTPIPLPPKGYQVPQDSKASN